MHTAATLLPSLMPWHCLRNAIRSSRVPLLTNNKVQTLKKQDAVACNHHVPSVVRRCHTHCGDMDTTGSAKMHKCRVTACHSSSHSPCYTRTHSHPGSKHTPGMANPVTGLEVVTLSAATITHLCPPTVCYVRFILAGSRHRHTQRQSLPM
jgi:hypothetical protein